jgi:5-methylcytosine-specific restriction endonuclease McrA
VGFNPRTIDRAAQRQSKMDDQGSWCARCGKSLTRNMFVLVSRIPTNTEEAWNLENCVILCSQCSTDVGQDRVTEISYNELPYFNLAPPNWSNNA